MVAENRGQRLVTVSREAIAAALLRDKPATTTTLPEDVELEELWHSENGVGFRMRVSSAEWDPLDEGDPIPETGVRITEDDSGVDA